MEPIERIKRINAIILMTGNLGTGVLLLFGGVIGLLQVFGQPPL